VLAPPELLSETEVPPTVPALPPQPASPATTKKQALRFRTRCIASTLPRETIGLGAAPATGEFTAREAFGLDAIDGCMSANVLRRAFHAEKTPMPFNRPIETLPGWAGPLTCASCRAEQRDAAADRPARSTAAFCFSPARRRRRWCRPPPRGGSERVRRWAPSPSGSSRTGPGRRRGPAPPMPRSAPFRRDALPRSAA
jgi:hypothetical protein